MLTKYFRNFYFGSIKNIIKDPSMPPSCVNSPDHMSIRDFLFYRIKHHRLSECEAKGKENIHTNSYDNMKYKKKERDLRNTPPKELLEPTGERL